MFWLECCGLTSAVLTLANQGTAFSTLAREHVFCFIRIFLITKSFEILKAFFKIFQAIFYLIFFDTPRTELFTATDDF